LFTLYRAVYIIAEKPLFVKPFLKFSLKKCRKLKNLFLYKNI